MPYLITGKSSFLPVYLKSYTVCHWFHTTQKYDLNFWVRIFEQELHRLSTSSAEANQ